MGYHGSHSHREFWNPVERSTAPLYKHLSLDVWAYRGYIETGAIGWVLSKSDPRIQRQWSRAKCMQGVVYFNEDDCFSIPVGPWKVHHDAGGASPPRVISQAAALTVVGAGCHEVNGVYLETGRCFYGPA